MPLLNMSADGDLYEASADESDGSGYERGVEDVDDVDASGWAEMGAGTGIDNPFVTAERIRSDERNDREAAQAYADNRSALAQKQRAYNERNRAYGQAMGAARSEEIRLAHMGQDPLLAMAIAQQMSGADFEQNSLSGYGHTSNGRWDGARTMSGRHSIGSLWDDVSAFRDEAVATVADVMEAKSDVMETYQAVAEGARDVLPIPASTPVVAAPKAQPASFLPPMTAGAKKAVKFAGLSLPVLAAVGIGAYFLMKRK
jgi:hypothetical protein